MKTMTISELKSAFDRLSKNNPDALVYVGCGFNRHTIRRVLALEDYLILEVGEVDNPDEDDEDDEEKFTPMVA